MSDVETFDSNHALIDVDYVAKLQTLVAAARRVVQEAEVTREQQFGTATKWVRLRAYNQTEYWKTWRRFVDALDALEDTKVPGQEPSREG